MKTYSRLTLAFLFLILVVPQVGAEESPENREAVVSWADSSGKFKIEASFVEFIDGKVVVLKRASDGKKIKVPFDKLDEQSQSQAKSLSLLSPKNGKHVEYYESGQKGLEAHFKNRWLDGRMTARYENGEKAQEIHFDDGIIVSASTWKPDGQPCPETKVVDGSGIIVGWHENGQKSEETHCNDGKLDGLATLWYENGQKRSEMHYKDGKPDGISTIWYENGQKLMESHYKNGEQDGLETWWDENGKKEYESQHKGGGIISHKEF